MTRRKFLFNSGAVLASIYALIPSLNDKAGDLYYFQDPQIQKLRRDVVGILETTHPEMTIVILTFRNLVMAQKIHATIKELNINNSANKSNISMTMGADHTGIESALLMREDDRIKFIEIIARCLPYSITEELDHVSFLEFVDSSEKYGFFRDPALKDISIEVD